MVRCASDVGCESGRTNDRSGLVDNRGTPDIYLLLVLSGRGGAILEPDGLNDRLDSTPGPERGERGNLAAVPRLAVVASKQKLDDIGVLRVDTGVAAALRSTSASVVSFARGESLPQYLVTRRQTGQ